MLRPACLTSGRKPHRVRRHGRLPKTVAPRHYTLRPQPDLEKRSTAGTATIEPEELQPLHELALNALALDAWVRERVKLPE